MNAYLLRSTSLVAILLCLTAMALLPASLQAETSDNSKSPNLIVSGVIGKWHLDAHEVLHPLNRGFDEFYGHLGGGHRYLPEELTIKESGDAKGENAKGKQK